MTHSIFDQGDIIWLNCDPHSGHEQGGRRPVLVASNADFNAKRIFAVVCPITNTKRADDPFRVPLDDRTATTGDILADQLRSFDIDSRDPQYIERAPDDIATEVLDLIAGITEAL